VFRKLNTKVKNLDMWDIACTKLAVMFFIAFFFSVWVGFRDFVLSINPWILFFAWVFFAIRPLKRFFRK
jgi:hypothetical protein